LHDRTTVRPDANHAGIQVSFTEALQQPGEKRFGEE
jgi:hypothetical protein